MYSDIAKILNKFDNGETLSEREIRQIIEYGIDEDAGKDRRWTRTVGVLSEIEGRYFYTEYEEGLTEYQDDEYSNQPIEVFKASDHVEIVKYSVKEYKDKNGNKIWQQKHIIKD